MCSVTLALAGLTTGLSMASQYQQSRAEAASLEAQAQSAKYQAEAMRQQAEYQRKYEQQKAEAEYQNARIQSRKGEQIAEQYADQQRQLDDRRRLIAGQQAAAAGASGIVGGVGSGLDIYNASMESWSQDTNRLLSNQRNSMYDNYLQEVNYRNAGNAIAAQAENNYNQGMYQADVYDVQSQNLRAQASMAKTMGNWAMIGTGLNFLGTTLAGGASSMGGAKEAAGTAQTPTAAGYIPQTADTINSGISGASGWIPQYSTGSIHGVMQNFGPKVLTNRYGTGLSKNGVYF